MRTGSFVRINHRRHPHYGEVAAVVTARPARRKGRPLTLVTLTLEDGTFVEASSRSLEPVR